MATVNKERKDKDQNILQRMDIIGSIKEEKI